MPAGRPEKEPKFDLKGNLDSLRNKLKREANKFNPEVEKEVDLLEEELFWFGAPVGPKEFIESPEYYNNNARKTVYSWVIDDLEEIFSGPYHAAKYQTVVEAAGTGSGKAYLAAHCDAYLIYWLKSFKSLKKYFATQNITWDDTATLSFINMAPSKDQAKKIVFETIKQIIATTKCFKDRDWMPYPNISSTLEFREINPDTGNEFTKIAIVPGNSSETMSLGYGIFGGIIDEANFFREKKDDPVWTLYEQLNNRRQSRFGTQGLVMLISSGNSDADITESFEAKAETDKTVFYKRRSRYDCKPEYFFLPRFDLEVKKEKINALTGQVEFVTYHLRPPEILRPFYEENKDKALRDIDAIPSIAGKPFYGDFMLLLSKINKERVDPAPDLGVKVAESPMDVYTRLPPSFQPTPGANYRIHVDLAKGNTKTGCAVGFAMSHKIADPNFGFKIKLDLAVRFKAFNKTIDFMEILEFIKMLKQQKGFGINMVTFDQWQSELPCQTINGWKIGILAEELKVDYKVHTYLKNLMTSGQMDFFADNNLFFELKRLEDYGTSVEPAMNSFKDEADAVAGCAYSAGALEAVKDLPLRPRVTTGILLRRPGNFLQQNNLNQPKYGQDSAKSPKWNR